MYGQDTSNTTIHDGFSVLLTDFERFNDLACLMFVCVCVCVCIEDFSRVYIASSKLEGGSENSRQLCKPSIPN